jgi:hypothetical protein
VKINTIVFMLLLAAIKIHKRIYMDITRFLIAIFFFTNLVSCKLSNDTQTLKTNIYSDTTLILKKKQSQGSIWGIDIKISGNIHDSVIIIHPNGKNVASRYNLFVRVDTTFHSDWYSDSCLIKFKKIETPIKNLQIEYKFIDL